MALKETRTIQVEQVRDIEVNASAITSMSVDLHKKRVDVQVQPGNLNSDGNFTFVGEAESYSIADLPERDEQVSEELTVDGDGKVVTSYPIKANLKVTHDGSVLYENTDYSRPDNQTIQVSDLVRGDVVSVSYKGTKPATTDLSELIAASVNTDYNLAGNLQLAVWSKLKEQGKVTGDIVESGTLL